MEKAVIITLVLVCSILLIYCLAKAFRGGTCYSCGGGCDCADKKKGICSGR
ncbi:MAG: hypothetical protein WC329_06835 [Candidatus Omnitrophota bacterium]|jgi:hypothetical protein